MTRLNELLRNKSENLQVAIVNRWPLIIPTLVNVAVLVALPVSAALLEGKGRTAIIVILALLFGHYNYNRGVEDTINEVSRKKVISK